MSDDLRANYGFIHPNATISAGTIVSQKLAVGDQDARTYRAEIRSQDSIAAAGRYIGLGVASAGLMLSSVASGWLVLSERVAWQLPVGLLFAATVAIGIIFDIVEFEGTDSPVRETSAEEADEAEARAYASVVAKAAEAGRVNFSVSEEYWPSVHYGRSRESP